MDVVADLANGASVRFADFRATSMNIAVDTTDEVDWVRCRVNNVVQSEDFERPFTIVMQLLDWVKVIGNSATCECEGFQFSADGNSVSLGNSTITFNIVQDLFQGIQGVIDGLTEPCEPCDEVTADQVAPSDSPSDVPSDMPTTVPSATPTTQPTASPSASPTATPSRTPTKAPTLFPTASPTVSPSDMPTVVPSDTPTTVPTSVPTASPSSTPTASPTASPSDMPTSVPSDVPTSTPSDVPTSVPSDVPTSTPSASPTASPSASPTGSPSDVPTSTPSDVPTATPSDVPTAVPSDVPTSTPSASPTASPSASPTSSPTASPSDMPSSVPSDAPTSVPSSSPTPMPTGGPTASPSSMPSDSPTSTPSDVPTSVPTGSPTSAPSTPPTPSPTTSPTMTPCIESISLVATNNTVLQDLATGDIIDFSTIDSTSLSILVDPAVAVTRIDFQWEESSMIQMTSQSLPQYLMGGKAGKTYFPVAYLSTPGVKSVLIDVYDTEESLLCRKFVTFTMIEYSGDSAVICANIKPVSESQENMVVIPPL